MKRYIKGNLMRTLCSNINTYSQNRCKINTNANYKEPDMKRYIKGNKILNKIGLGSSETKTIY
jgi:hypothetical protein